MLEKLTLKDLDLHHKKVLMRVDFNVPIAKDGTIADDTRIKESLPSIQHVISQGGSVILMSHLGRPDGNKELKYSLKPCQERLTQLLGRPVLFANDCISDQALMQKSSIKPRQVLLLENLRFYSAEEHPEQDPWFAKKLAQHCDVFVNDAFGTAHRAHSSTVTITQYFPKTSAMGCLMEKEISYLKKTIDTPKRPFYAVIGGSKVSSKLGVLTSLFSKVDKLFIGGGMAFTFLRCLGYKIGNSLIDSKKLADVEKFLAKASKNSAKIYFPEDIIIGKTPEDTTAGIAVTIKQGIPSGYMGLDIGPQTLKSWEKALAGGNTFFWNGPVGVFENPYFAQGTTKLAEIISKQPGIKIVGGGDSVLAVNKLGCAPSFSHLSTGGGASLELIEFGHLPGIDALSNKNT